MSLVDSHSYNHEVLKYNNHLLYMSHFCEFLGASTVNYTSPAPCISLSEIELKLYTNFEFCEGKTYRHLEKHIDLQSQAMYVDQSFFSRKVYIF